MHLSADFPTSPYPKGWFIIGRSHDVAKGEVKALKYFGENLVLWRGESGELFLQDAYCLHLGAHRGIKGTVKGDDIVCPWHGWQWSGEGRNTCIPYKDEPPKRQLRIRTYPVKEWYGMVVAWYAPTEGAAEWELSAVPELTREDWFPMFPHGAANWQVKGHVQMPVENAADLAHIHFVHGSKHPASIVSLVMKAHQFIADVDVMYGGGREGTVLTPIGEKIAGFRIEHEGTGIAVIRWGEQLWPTVLVTAFTAVDAHTFDYFFQISSQRGENEAGDVPQGRAARMLKMQLKVSEEDFFTWENMKVLPRANFALCENQNYGRLRYWARQFYPETSADYREPGDAPAVLQRRTI